MRIVFLRRIGLATKIGIGLNALYFALATYAFDIPDLCHLHAADLGFLTIWNLRSWNLFGSVFMVALTQVCWRLKILAFAPNFREFSLPGVFAIVEICFLLGVAQWLLAGRFLSRLLRRSSAKVEAPDSKQNLVH